MKFRSKILVCIAFHYNESKVKYVKQLIDNYATYDEDIDIIVDCNTQTSFKNARVYQHTLEKPYSLTYVHRKHFVDNINNYDYFMYVEDDMLVCYDAFREYISNFNNLWELGYVPSFIRVEYYDGKQFVTDITQQQSINVTTINGKFFASLSESYHAFWIMPQKQLKESITPDFTKLDEWRELAASYPARPVVVGDLRGQLLKTPMVRIENNQISELSYSYHLPNNYASDPNSIFGKIEIKNLIKSDL